MAEAAARPSFSQEASPAVGGRGGESRSPSVCSSVILDAKEPPAKSEAAPKPPASAPPSILVKPDTSRNNAEKVCPGVPCCFRGPQPSGEVFRVSPVLRSTKSLEGFTPFNRCPSFAGTGTHVKESVVCVTNAAAQMKPSERQDSASHICMQNLFSHNQILRLFSGLTLGSILSKVPESE